MQARAKKNLFYVDFYSNFGTPLPLRGGFPPKVRSRPAGHTQGRVTNFSRAKPYVLCSSMPSVSKLPRSKTNTKQ